MKDIAVLVRNARKEQKATQVELAQFANVGTRFVRDVEDGKESVQFDKLMRVLSTLGLKVEIARISKERGSPAGRFLPVG